MGGVRGRQGGLGEWDGVGVVLQRDGEAVVSSEGDGAKCLEIVEAHSGREGD